MHLPCDALVSRTLARFGGILEGGVNVVRRELWVRGRSSACRLRSGCHELETPCTPCKCATKLLRHVPPWDLHVGSAVHFARASTGANRGEAARGNRARRSHGCTARRPPRIPPRRLPTDADVNSDCGLPFILHGIYPSENVIFYVTNNAGSIQTR